MATLDIFQQDPFRTITLTSALEKVPYIPDGIETMGIYEDKPVRTEELWIEDRQGTLAIVPFSDRGAPGTQRTTEKRKARAFKVPRLRVEDTITARELAGIREFGSETELMQVMKEVGRRFAGPTGLRSQLAYTQEFHKLACVQGKLIDADGSVLYDWYDEFNIAPAPTVDFNLTANTAGTIRPLAAGIQRSMMRKAQGAWRNSTTVVALCGDAFYDTFVTHTDVEKTFANWQAAQALRQGTAFKSDFVFADIVWINYRGSDDTFAVSCAVTKNSATVTPASLTGILVGMNVSGYGVDDGTTVASINSGAGTFALSAAFTGNTGAYVFNFGAGKTASGGGDIAIPTNEAIFFPKGAPGVFQRGLSPGDSAEWINTLGKPEYVRMIPDRDRNEWVKMELDNYPLHICTRPEMLNRARM